MARCGGWLAAGTAALIAVALLPSCAGPGPPEAAPPTFEVLEDAERIRISGPLIEAAVRKSGYVSGVEGGSFLDRASGFRDAGIEPIPAGPVSRAGSRSKQRKARGGEHINGIIC